MKMAVIYFDVRDNTWNMIKFGFKEAYSSAEYESFILGINLQFISAFFCVSILVGHIQFVLDFLYYSEPGNLYFSLLTAQMDLQELFCALFAVYQVTVTLLEKKI
jgi:hypothetical protein